MYGLEAGGFVVSREESWARWDDVSLCEFVYSEIDISEAVEGEFDPCRIREEADYELGDARTLRPRACLEKGPSTWKRIVRIEDQTSYAYTPQRSRREEIEG